MVSVSVIIPTYNRPKSLRSAIECALGQTLSDIEVIVVDDHSDTDTRTVIGGFDDSRLQYLRHDENRGGSAARNTGIQYASGEYIAFLDDDDEWNPSKLQLQKDLLDSVSKQWVGCYCDVAHKRTNPLVEAIESIVPTRPTRTEGGEELIAEIMMKRLHHGGTSTLFVRSEAIDAIGGFDESFVRHQEIEFLLRLLKTGKLKHLDKELVIRNDTGNPPLATVERSNIDYMAKFSDEIFELREQGEDVAGVQEFRISKEYFRNGDFRRGVGSLLKASIPRRKDYFVLIYTILVGLRTLSKSLSSTRFADHNRSL